MLRASLPFSPRSVLITDFDGTLTRHDFFELAVARHLEPGTPDYWSQYTTGRLTHFQAMQAIYSHIRASEAELRRTVRDMELEPDLELCLRKLDAAGWDVVVASNGCEWYIRQLFAEAGVDLPLFGNPGEFDEARGLLLDEPRGSEFFTPSHGIDKAAMVRAAKQRSRQVAFAGNGPPDVAAAMEVEADLRFATGWLAGELARSGTPFRNFERWREVAAALANVAASK